MQIHAFGESTSWNYESVSYDVRGTGAIVFWGGGQGFVDDCLMSCWGKA